MLERRFECSSEGLIEAQAFLEQLCPEPRPSIVVDEIASNIVRCSGAKDFLLSVDKNEDEITIVFVDDGVAFDPTRETRDPDVTASAEDRAIGGLGVYMVRKMAKVFAYRRENGKNVLTIVMPVKATC